MALNISSLDLHYIIKEMQFLKGAKVDRITQPDSGTVVLQLYATGKGKHSLTIRLPGLFYLSEQKHEPAEKQFGFCAALRKYLSNSRVESIEQEGSERIVRILFKTREEEFFVIAELFTKGNIMLCRKNMEIIVPMRTEKLKARELRAGKKYVFPEKKIDFFKLKAADIKKCLRTGETISKILAVQLGFGGIYAKEICSIAGIGISEKKLNDEKIKVLLKSIKEITNKKIAPSVIYEKIIRPVPFELEIYKNSKREKKETFSSAVDFAVSQGIVKPKSKQEKEIEKIKRIIETQDNKIRELEESADENQRKGELIYEKYQLISEIMQEIKKAREKYSWKEIKGKLKGHKLIKEVNEKNKEIIVEF
jgi:predicted ribosome quality control (RQC) complex YloA/Tae2 family protein